MKALTYLLMQPEKIEIVADKLFSKLTLYCLWAPDYFDKCVKVCIYTKLL